MITPEEPPPSPKPGRATLPETDEKLAWLRAHPGEWLAWNRTGNTLPRYLQGPNYERAYRKTPEGRTAYVRLIHQPFEDQWKIDNVP